MARNQDKSRKKNPGLRAGVLAAIQKRRLELRGGRSIAETSRHQWDIDSESGETRPIRNRTTYCKAPDDRPNRMLAKSLVGEVGEGEMVLVGEGEMVLMGEGEMVLVSEPIELEVTA